MADFQQWAITSPAKVSTDFRPARKLFESEMRLFALHNRSIDRAAHDSRESKAGSLMPSARFRDIGYYNTAGFGIHPYRNGKPDAASPPFFIAYAAK
jgi:hypothetical protein